MMTREPLRRQGRALVFRQDELAGTIDRTAQGASFRYVPDFLRVHGKEPRGIAYNLPCRAEPFETVGVNLHTFFAGLLPEGVRYDSLVESAKTSDDDLLTLLMAAGSDTVGDVSVVPEGQAPVETAATADVASSDMLSFPKLFEQSLRYGTRGHAEAVVPGVQHKMSAAMLASTVRGRGRAKRYVLKLNPPDLPRLVENEQFFMTLAATCGLEVAATRLVQDREGNSALLVERFDRVPGTNGGAPIRIHQEDICQILDRYPADKYNLGYDEVARAFELCSAPIVELAKLLRLVAFAYVIGDGDLHGKNISLRTTPAGRIEMTEAYDLLSTLPYGDRTMALAFEERDDNLKRRAFVEFGERFGVRGVATEAILDEVADSVRRAIPTLGTIGLGALETRYLESTIKKRVTDLTG
jgi:serine/threonine-protein kinase HipA